ncbi:MAG: glutamine--fructose-6-phosphate transaminase (isomerizing) [Patescibacteria group bacterium]
MSGIVGYIGSQTALPRVLRGMRRFENRWYDSAGLAWHDGMQIQTAKIVGGLSQFEKQLAKYNQDTRVAVGHMRWATHGEVSIKNAHPHFDGSRSVAIVHKGVIENHAQLKLWLTKRGHFFASETDSEVLAHLIGELYRGDILDATRTALSLIEGSYAIAVLCSTESDRVIVARRGQPLVIGVGENEMMFATSVEAVMSVTRNVVYLDDNQIGDIRPTKYDVYNTGTHVLSPDVVAIKDEIKEVPDPSGFKNAMLREIFEQPKSLEQVMRGRMDVNGNGNIVMPGLESHVRQLLQYERLLISACGTSWHAGIVGKYVLEELLGVSITLEYASEFRYRNIPLDTGAILVVLSQSGENEDTTEAMRKASSAGMFTVGITNAPGSPISKETDCGIHLRVGSQLGISSTKTFSAEVLAFALFGFYLAQKQGLEIDNKIIHECRLIPEKVETTLVRIHDKVEEIAEKYLGSKRFLVVGQAYGLPVALEGGFKLRDIARKHVEFYHGAEHKVGKRLVEPGTPVVAVVNHDDSYEAALETLADLKAKGGRIIAIVPEHDDQVKEIAEDVITIPETLLLLTPVLNVLPLQLLAYYLADKQGIDVDR